MWPINYLIGMLSNIYWLCWNVILWYFGLNTWDDVQVWLDTVVNNFDFLADQVINTIGGLLGNFQAWVIDTFGWIPDWVTWAEQQFNALFFYISQQLNEVYQWYLSVKNSIGASLGPAWDWLVNLFNNTLAVVDQWLGGFLEVIIDFFSDPLAFLDYWLGGFLAAILDFFSDPIGTIQGWLADVLNLAVWLANNIHNIIMSVLGPAWGWLLNLFNNPLGVIAGLLGPVWQFIKALFEINPNGLLAFIRDSLVYYYSIWANFRLQLFQLLSDPVTYILLTIRDYFLDWLLQLIADNWDTQ